MPRGRRRIVVEEDVDDDVVVDEEEVNDQSDDELRMAEEEVKNNTTAKKTKRNNKSRRSKRKSDLASDEEDENNDDDDYNNSQMRFSSQIPDATQDIGDVKVFERNNLSKLSDAQRNKALQDLTRLVLFKGLAGEAIDRTKCLKEAGIEGQAARISSAAFDEVNHRLRNIFDFELVRQPEWMNNVKGCNSTKATKDKYYLINVCQDDDGMHCKTLHSVHESSSIEKGLLMVVLSFAYCKGEPRKDGSRWILDKHLYQLLNKIDENIPAEPPIYGAGGRSRVNRTGGQGSDIGGVSQTPDVDSTLEKFVRRDYLLKEKATDEQITNGGGDLEERSMYYSMGPRAAAEIGRKQVIYFCAELLDEEPDLTMLAELEHMNNDDDDSDDDDGKENVEE